MARTYGNLGLVYAIENEWDRAKNESKK